MGRRQRWVAQGRRFMWASEAGWLLRCIVQAARASWLGRAAARSPTHPTHPTPVADTPSCAAPGQLDLVGGAGGGSGRHEQQGGQAAEGAAHHHGWAAAGPRAVDVDVRAGAGGVRRKASESEQRRNEWRGGRKAPNK